ncbi:TerC family protein [Bacillus andreraoultii]|uniref:TerC family protein n=1 Tax=Bacillus andreraoultii TaxID=1499685 RepID=UPI00053B2663|nr:TerC family protein [Bacillus andreraoultii]
MELAWSAATIIAVLKIIAIDIILSGDNAVVIAMATRRLPVDKRNIAIGWGTIGAVILRIVFASIIALLLGIPYVHFVGGLLLLWISYKVLVNHEDSKDVKAKDTTLQAIGTIIMADAVMSLDNVVAIAGASGGHIVLIAMGVLVSIPIMIFGSKLIVRLMERFAIVPYIGSAILAWTASDMITGDERIAAMFHIEKGPFTYVFAVIVTAIVLILGYISNKKFGQTSSSH